ADFRRARPVREVFPELLEAVKHARGRPKLAQTKQHISLRLDPHVIAGFKAMGPGWQRRINEVLARALARSRANATATKPRKPARRRAA
ncbi:MAG: BrnA antitoxin family protein, partial [Rhodospirillaceae bacterium]|nr:BrnA antitoxin family protein [Rhodospirillaceae bacterium]